MSQWKSADLSQLLPPGTVELISLMQSSIEAISAPLRVVSSAMDVAKQAVIDLPVVDYAASLRVAIEEFKRNFLMTGVYTLPLWDYPLRQLQMSSSYGPERDYGTANLRGTRFSDLVDDIARSFYDIGDLNRPQFSGPVAMFAMVTADADLSSIRLSPEEDSARLLFPDMADLTGVGNGIRYARWRLAWSRMRARAAMQGVDQAKSSLSMVSIAHERWSEMDDLELDGVPPPGFDISDPYYENTAVDSIPWSSVAASTAAVSSAHATSRYPDWARTSIGTIIPPLQEFVDSVCDPVLASLEVGASAQGQIVDLIAAVERRVAFLEDLLLQIDSILAQLEPLMSAVGYRGLFLSTNDGVDDLVARLRACPDPYGGTEMFYYGAVYLVGGASVAPFTALFSGVTE